MHSVRENENLQIESVLGTRILVVMEFRTLILYCASTRPHKCNQIKGRKASMLSLSLSLPLYLALSLSKYAGIWQTNVCTRL